MAASAFNRLISVLLPIALVIVALEFPDATEYLKWPLLVLYLFLSYVMFSQLRDQSWIFRVVNDPATRIAHGLEHATLAVLAETRDTVLHGFTHRYDRFMVALKAEDALEVTDIEEAATRAIRRIQQGERALAYNPGCGTSALVSALSAWLIYVPSLVLAFVVDGSTAVFFAFSVIVHGLWFALHEPLGLLAQRLFTVSTAFTAARVVKASERDKVYGRSRPGDERWFEIVVDVQREATQGGLVAPGPL